MHQPGYRFEPGKLDLLRIGQSAAVFATGGVVMHALQAAEELSRRGIEIAVINVPSIKPLDAAGVREWTGKTPLIVTVEDHNVLGGMGGAVAEIAAEGHKKARVYRHGMYDTFGESGSTAELYRKYKLDAEGIAEVVRQQLSR